MTKTSDNGDGMTARSGSGVFFYFNIPTGTGGIIMDTGNTGFMMICTALVFIMTPGLAFFYGGLVRRKNVCNTMMACVSIMGLSVIMWTLIGYSLALEGTTRDPRRFPLGSVKRRRLGGGALLGYNSTPCICGISDDVRH